MAKTNKTDHVLSLLSKGKSAEGPKDAPPVDLGTESAEETPAKEETVNSGPQANISVVDENDAEREAETADMIKNSLEAEFENEMEKEAGKMAENPEVKEAVENEEEITDAAPQEEAAPEKEAAPAPEEVTEEEKAPEEAPEEEAPSESAEEQEDEPEARQSAETADPDDAGFVNPAAKRTEPKPGNEEGLITDSDPDHPYTMINVMEALVDKRLPEYMEDFEMCTCHRCQVDVKALTLTHLPPKYIVAKKGALPPILNFYDKKYEGEVTVELTRACILVHEEPHH